jgi:hypothetical protein
VNQRRSNNRHVLSRPFSPNLLGRDRTCDRLNRFGTRKSTGADVWVK